MEKGERTRSRRSHGSKSRTGSRVFSIIISCWGAREAHEGNISVESAVGKGTTFTVTIPIKPKLEGGEKIWVKTPESLLSTTTKA